jgi:hypothetical protein
MELKTVTDNWLIVAIILSYPLLKKNFLKKITAGQKQSDLHLKALENYN